MYKRPKRSSFDHYFEPCDDAHTKHLYTWLNQLEQSKTKYLYSALVLEPLVSGIMGGTLSTQPCPFSPPSVEQFFA
jgi:hypothetical protein